MEVFENREKLAELCHDQWSTWMQYLFSKCTKNDLGEVVIPKWAVEQWTRQMNTKYKDLSYEEKESDRREAVKFLNFL